MSKIKILLISWTAYPLKSGSSVIVNNLATHFSQEELVIVAEKPTNPDTKDWDPSWPKIHYLGKDIRWPKRGKKYFRWIKWLFLPYYYFKLRVLAKKEKIDAIVTVFPNEFYLFLGTLISINLKLPFFPWFHNTYIENRSGLSFLFAKWLQPIVFKKASAILVLSEGMKKHYRESYKSLNLKILLHGFPLPKIKVKDSFSSKQEKVKFLFLGNFNQACIDASKRLILSIVKNPSFEVHICSPTPQWIFEREGLRAKNIVYRGFVEELGEELNQYNIMLLPHGFEGGLSEIEYKTIFPTRTIFLLSSNKPILAHCPPNCYLTSFLTKNDCAKVVTEKDPSSILTAIDELLENKERTKQLVNNALKASQMFDLAVVANNLKSFVYKEVKT